MFDHKMKFLTAIIFSLTVFAFLAQAQVCSPTPSGIVAWYPADGNANDISGNGNHGTLQNGATFAAGQVGQAFSFDGVDDFINIADSASLDSLTTTASFEAWINPQEPMNGEGAIFVRRNPFASESFSVHVNLGTFLVLVLGTTANGTVAFQMPDGSIQFGQWQHVAVTVNTTTGVSKAYINGQEVMLTPFVGSTISGQLNDASSHFIGQRQAANPDPRHYKGLIDEATVYNRDLSASEIQAIFNAGSAGKCKPVVTAATVSVSGRVLALKNRSVSRAVVYLTDADGYTRSTLTNNFGFYRFEAVEVGQTYIFNVFSKKYQFEPRVVTIFEDTDSLNFSPNP